MKRKKRWLWYLDWLVRILVLIPFVYSILILFHAIILHGFGLS